MSELQDKCEEVIRSVTPPEPADGVYYAPGFFIDDEGRAAVADIQPIDGDGQSVEIDSDEAEAAAYEVLLRAAQAHGLVMVEPGVFTLQ